jgi:hypothetical protein
MRTFEHLVLATRNAFLSQWACISNLLPMAGCKKHYVAQSLKLECGSNPGCADCLPSTGVTRSSRQMQRKTLWNIFAVVTLVAVAVSGCTTVELDPENSSTRVRMPGDMSGARPGAYPSVPVATETMSMPNTSSIPFSAAKSLITLTTKPDSNTQIPPTASDGSAQIDLVYDDATRQLRWKAVWANLTSPISDIRFFGPAAPGQSGPPTLIWPGPFGPRYEGRAILTPQQAADMLGGLWYITISTMNYPGGEIRGQLRVVK